MSPRKQEKTDHRSRSRANQKGSKFPQEISWIKLQVTYYYLRQVEKNLRPKVIIIGRRASPLFDIQAVADQLPSPEAHKKRAAARTESIIPPDHQVCLSPSDIPGLRSPRTRRDCSIHQIFGT
jgi:hypothetical protein